MGSSTVTAAAFLALVLGGCSVGADHASPSSTGGAVELAVSHTCAEDRGTDCVAVNGEHVSIPSDFERAGVDDVSADAGDTGTDTIRLTFDDDGTALLQSSSEEVARAGETARLVIKVDGEVLAAVRVPAPLVGGDVQLAVSDDASAEDLVELIRGA